MSLGSKSWHDVFAGHPFESMQSWKVPCIGGQLGAHFDWSLPAVNVAQHTLPGAQSPLSLHWVAHQKDGHAPESAAQVPFSVLGSKQHVSAQALPGAPGQGICLSTAPPPVLAEVVAPVTAVVAVAVVPVVAPLPAPVPVVLPTAPVEVAPVEVALAVVAPPVPAAGPADKVPPVPVASAAGTPKRPSLVVSPPQPSTSPSELAHTMPRERRERIATTLPEARGVVRSSGSTMVRLAMSGHSKWATIKHRKGAADAKRGKLFTKLIKELTVAARMGGGDADGNPRLRKAVNEAKGAQMPSDTIARAIKRGTGELEGESYDEIVYEGTGPGGTLYLIEAMTDNRNRTVAELRKMFERHGGALAAGGAAMWAFDKKGLVLVPRDAADEEKLMELTMDVGAENVAGEGDAWQVQCAVSDLDAVATVLEKAGIKVSSAKPGYVPKTRKPLEGDEAEKALSLVEALDDHDDAQNVYADFDVSDDELARLSAE